MATKQAEEMKAKGNDEFKKGNHAKAIEYYTYATELDPNNSLMYTNRSNAYYQMKNWEKSARDARKAIEKDSKNVKGYYRLGMALMEMNQLKEAKDAFQQAVTLDNAKTESFSTALAKCKAMMMKDMSDADRLKTEGNEAYKSGRIEEAVGIYTRAIAACKNTEKDIEIKCDCLANRAACRRQLYLPEECIADCAEVLALKPDHFKALIRRGQAYESMEKYQKALDDFIAASRIDPSAKIAYEGVARLRTSMKQFGSAKN
jgi:tetratricopeptide (TPR) repeat protein